MNEQFQVGIFNFTHYHNTSYFIVKRIACVCFLCVRKIELPDLIHRAPSHVCVVSECKYTKSNVYLIRAMPRIAKWSQTPAVMTVISLNQPIRNGFGSSLHAPDSFCHYVRRYHCYVNCCTVKDIQLIKISPKFRCFPGKSPHMSTFDIFD